MKYQKIEINLLSTIKNWVEINDESRGMYNEGNQKVDINDESRGIYDKDNQIRFKTSMLWSSLCNYYLYLLKEL